MFFYFTCVNVTLIIVQFCSLLSISLTIQIFQLRLIYRTFCFCHLDDGTPRPSFLQKLSHLLWTIGSAAHLMQFNKYHIRRLFLENHSPAGAKCDICMIYRSSRTQRAAFHSSYPCGISVDVCILPSCVLRNNKRQFVPRTQITVFIFCQLERGKELRTIDFVYVDRMSNKTLSRSTYMRGHKCATTFGSSRNVFILNRIA